MVQDLYFLCLQVEAERAMEGDQSKVPDELKSALTTLCEAFKEMAVEEVEELLDL